VTLTVGKFLTFDEKKVAFPNIVSILRKKRKTRREKERKGEEGEAEVYAKNFPLVLCCVTSAKDLGF
jgi:hypothetical protein